VVAAAARMNSRNWLNLGLLLVVGGLVAVAVLQPGVSPAPTTQRVSTLDPASIQQMTLRRPGQPVIQLQRDQQGHWQMQTPYRAAANRFVAADLTALLGAESSAHYPLADIDPANIGLQPALATLTLDATELRFGDIDPVHGNRYLQIGDSVHLLPDHLTPYPELGALEMLSTALLPDGAVIESLRLPALPSEPPANAAEPRPAALPATLPYLIERSDGSWRIAPPQSLSGDALPSLINEWTHAQAITVTAYTAVPSASLGRIDVALQSGQQLVFELLQLSPELILARADSGLRYQLSLEQAARLLLPAAHNPAAGS
jgi:hypothetical protein